jgi:hypothetical protein
MCYATGAESAGFIPDGRVRRFLCYTPARVRALDREGLWIRDEGRGGWVLNREVWSEERNLSDQAEKKREADRVRIAGKRAAARAAAENGSVARLSRDMSRDTLRDM